MKIASIASLSTLLALGGAIVLPTLAQAADLSTPIHTQTRTETTTYTTQPNSTTTTTTTQTVQTHASDMYTLPGLTETQQQFHVNEVVVGPDQSLSDTPPISIGQGNTSIRVINPTPKPVAFTAPDVGINTVIAANSERVIQIDETQTANLTPGQNFAYYIVDPNNNQVASNVLVYDQDVVAMIDTNTQIADMTAPKTATRSNVSRHAAVRGYW